MGTSSFRAAGVLLVALAWSASCVEAPAPTPSPSQLDETIVVTPDAFRETPAGFVTSGARWSARVTPDGSVELAAHSVLPAMAAVETVSIARDTRSEVSAGRVQREGSSIAIARDEATEVISQRDSGVEQTWRFDEVPTGDGALDVVVALRGAAYAGHDESGLRFVSPQTGARFRYGVATWVDARGERTRVPTVASNGTITMTVSERVLEGSAYPAVLDPLFEPAIELDPTSVYATAPGPQEDAVVASDGVDALVAWRDERDNPFEIFGTGVAADGSAYQRANVRLADIPLFGQRLAYVRTDTNTGDRHYVMVATNLFEVFAIPIVMNAAGILSVSPPITLFTPPPQVFSGVIDVAANAAGDQYLVLFHAGDSGNDNAHIQLFDALDHQPITALQTPYTVDFPQGFQGSVVFDTTDYIVLSRRGPGDGNPLLARVVSSVTGAETSSFVVTAGGNNPDEPSLAHNGQSAFAVWSDRRNEEHVWGRRLNEAGNLSAELDLSGLVAGQYAPDAIAGDPTLDDFFVVWRDDRNVEGEVFGATVSGANAVTLFPSGVVREQPRGARVGGAPLVVYSEDAENSDVWSHDFAANWGTAQVISEEANRQTGAAIDSAAGASGLVAWTDTRTDRDNTDVFGLIVDSMGAPTSARIPIGSDLAPEDEIDVATGTGESVVVWRRGDVTPGGGVTTQIIAALVSSAGAVVGTTVVASGRVHRFPRIVRDGSSYLVTWQRGDFSCEAFCQFFPAEPQLSTLTTSATSISASAPVDGPETGLAPALARSANGNVLWVWEHDGDIHAARVTQGVAAAPLVIAASAGRQSRPAVAMDDLIALVAYEDDRDGGSQIFASLLDAADTVTPLGSVSGTIEAREPEVVDADDGYSFLVAWEGSAFGAPEQIWGGWVKKTGSLEDPEPLELTSDLLGASRRPNLTALGGGALIVAFDTVSDERSERASSMAIDSGQEDGTLCDIPNQCASRFCADGVCCTEACDAPCEQCGDGGVCLAVANAEDDSCFGDEKCSADGVCLRNDGETCDDGTECATGFCVDGVCCESECSGACDKCGGTTAGQCRPQACGNFGCHDDKTCRETCSESRHCLDGFQCVDGACVTPPELSRVDVGCGCEVAGGGPSGGEGWLWLAGLIFLRRRETTA